MPTLIQKFRGHKECTLCSEIKPKKAFKNKGAELLQCSGAHKNMHCCNDCFKNWKSTCRQSQNKKWTCPLCNGMSFDTHDILNTLLGGAYTRFGKKRRIITGKRGGKYYTTDKGSKVYIKK